jgi:hypothetical protein
MSEPTEEEINEASEFFNRIYNGKASSKEFEEYAEIVALSHAVE